MKETVTAVCELNPPLPLGRSLRNPFSFDPAAGLLHPIKPAGRPSAKSRLRSRLMQNLTLENNLGTAGSETRRASAAAEAHVPWRLRPVITIPCKATVARE